MQLLPADTEFCVKTICKELVTLSSEDINQIDYNYIILRVIFGEIYGKNYIKLVSYNIRFGLGTDQKIDLERIADTVKDADIIALQEVDRCWKRSGMTDQPEIIFL